MFLTCQTWRFSHPEDGVPAWVGGSQIRTTMGTPRAIGHLCILTGAKPPPLATSCLNLTRPPIQHKWHLHQEALPDHPAIGITLPTPPHHCHFIISPLAFPLTFIVIICAYIMAPLHRSNSWTAVTNHPQFSHACHQPPLLQLALCLYS